MLRKCVRQGFVAFADLWELLTDFMDLWPLIRPYIRCIELPPVNERVNSNGEVDSTW